VRRGLPVYDDWHEARPRFSLRVRWQVFRHRQRFTWRDLADDLRYLLRG